MPSTFDYSVKLLFQWRRVVGRRSGKVRTCEERIVTFKARNAEDAWRKGNRLGKDGEFDYANSLGGTTQFEFIGIMEMLQLGLEIHPGEVWWDIVDRLKPSERRSRFIPPKERLQAFRNQPQARPRAPIKKKPRR